MVKSKFKIVFLILFLITLLSGAFISLDFMRFFIMQENSFVFSYIFKVLIVILTTILVFIINKNALSTKDIERLKIIYIFILLSDFSLAFFKKPYVGIIFFSIVQILLINRNGIGILSKIKSNLLNLIIGKPYINIILTYVFFILIMASIMINLIEEKVLFYMFLYYLIIISFSLLTAIINLKLNIFPKVNSILVTLGLIFFLLCDINVGLTMILKTETISLFTDSFIWIFYTPALTLIALSGYDFT